MSEQHTVLLINHDQPDGRLIQAMLARAEGAAFDLLCVSGLAGAKKHLALGGIDAILLDLSASEIDGIQALSELHDAAPNVPVLLLSDADQNGFTRKAIEHGAEDTLQKKHLHTGMLIRVLDNTIHRQRFRDRSGPATSRFQRLINKNADAIVVVNQGGVIRYVNPAAEVIFQRRAEELIGTQFGFPMVHGESAEIDIFRKHDTKAVAEMRVVETEWANETAYLASLRDVSDRKRTEETLQRYERIVALSKDLICLVDRDFVILEANTAFKTKFGRQTDSLIGLNAADVFDRQLFEKHLQPRIERCLSGLERHHQMWLDFAGQEQRFADIAYYPYLETDEAISGVIINIRDITETKTLEEQLQKSQKMESIGTLAGGIAHDFNNMLMGIQGRAALMMMSTDVDHTFHDHLRGIEEIVASAADLTRQLLGFARGGKYHVVPTDLNRLIRKTAEMFSRTRREVEIHTDLAPGLWAVEVDRSQFGQVFLNLFVNAWQAMPDGGELFIRSENILLDEHITQPFDAEPGKYVKLSVTDTGTGMDKATRQRIFDPFFSTKKKERGSGLGLASVYGIVRNHEGFIDVYSELNRGATFTIYLPASDRAPIEDERHPATIHNGSETILLVDDEQIVIDVAQGMLQKLGYDVITAGSGKEALKSYGRHKHKIDLVILDMIMPGMGGRKTYERLQAADPDVKVLLASGYSINGQARQILARGCNGFIQKPFTTAGLSQKIRDILDQGASRRP